MSWYQRKKLFITGGSSGIGKATATLAAQQGADIWIAARRQSVLEEAIKEIELHRTRDDQIFGFSSVDISDRDAVNSVAAQVLDEMDGVDVVINNAGISHVARHHEEDAEVYERVMQINYFGAVWVTRAFLPHLVEKEGGHVHFVSSVLGRLGCYGYAAYAASKHAMIGYASCLRQDLLAHDIGVSVSCPPDTETPQHAAEIESMPGETRAVSGTITCLPAETVAQSILDGIRTNRFETRPGLENYVLLTAAGHFPGVARWVMDRDLWSYWKDNGKPEPQSLVEATAQK